MRRLCLDSKLISDGQSQSTAVIMVGLNFGRPSQIPPLVLAQFHKDIKDTKKEGLFGRRYSTNTKLITSLLATLLLKTNLPT